MSEGPRRTGNKDTTSVPRWLERFNYDRNHFRIASWQLIFIMERIFIWIRIEIFHRHRSCPGLNNNKLEQWNAVDVYTLSCQSPREIRQPSIMKEPRASRASALSTFHWPKFHINLLRKKRGRIGMSLNAKIYEIVLWGNWTKYNFYQKRWIGKNDIL